MFECAGTTSLKLNRRECVEASQLNVSRTQHGWWWLLLQLLKYVQFRRYPSLELALVFVFAYAPYVTAEGVGLSGTRERMRNTRTHTKDKTTEACRLSSMHVLVGGRRHRGDHLCGDRDVALYGVQPLTDLAASLGPLHPRLCALGWYA